ncbi:uncharacterized protein FFUJ_11923 [Fusarium fujikuroi IMI 58289]|uniref:Uncharacterized protein n=1 Tax=Gibberella fujikuroi (strain CBS 195.34 / IMI 58289 / NRRL A-6831) TaxID=1279085 RepID=S0ELG2_GIBF5|nr:uncharacterized protein FFUJ_11923 [Fusarium fujikuroi IMI 58289]CCT75878.1 uncharacterized protein FFUJ_11923 [Fusarium fujikuroi IMI 58289]SCO14696.1 uncharacterized protein FFM5_10928 [Fusarium fujikuroi]
MPHVSKDTFKGIPVRDYCQYKIPSPFVKDEWKLEKALKAIFDGDGTPRDYHGCEVDMVVYLISSWEYRDLLPQLQAMEDSGIRQGSLKDAQKEQKAEAKAAKGAKRR